MAMQEAIAVGMPSSTEIRFTDGGPATPAPPRHSEWWWMPVGLVTAGATVTALRAGLRRRQAESRFAPRTSRRPDAGGDGWPDYCCWPLVATSSFAGSEVISSTTV